MRLSILGLFAIAILTFSACQKNDTNITDEKMTDAELILAIQNASNKQNIDLSELPATSKSTLEKDYADDIFEAAKVVPELGYEVDLRKGSGPRVAAYIQAYFNMEGRELREDDSKSEGDNDKDEWGDKDGKECFVFDLPVTFIMPDDSEITIEDKEDWSLIKAWYQAHPDVRERPEVQFPVDIIIDDKVISVNNGEEMRRVQEECKGDTGQKERCFELVYPVTFEMPDGTSIAINSDEEMKAARMEWKEAGVRPTLQFPVEVTFGDKVITVNSREEMRRLKESCDDGNGHHVDKKKCFQLVYPVTFIMSDGTEITIDSKDDREGWQEMKAWYEAHPDADKKHTLQFPVDIKWKDGTVQTINGDEEMRAAKKKCGDGDWGKKRCFLLVYPVTRILPDGTEIIFQKKGDREAMAAIKAWYERHPDVTEKPVLQYPVEIKYKDGSIVTINSKDEMIAAKEACEDED